MNKDQTYMQLALTQAKEAFDKDEVPVGAVIVHKDKIIAKAYNNVELLCDPAAHAEIIAITQAASFLQSKWLDDSTLYVTIEPCSMCAGALILSRISRVVYGAADPKTGGFGSKVDINNLGLNHRIEISGGTLENECAALLQEFFKKKRRAKRVFGDAI
ncbi:MAG: tRNA adenosine(34) deaminase TadA [Candidatus Omnitrophica bacterium]|nr:tRNA adenosine(34) deaminase TadA [Candidatus Omnitrophota bacterium]